MEKKEDGDEWVYALEPVYEEWVGKGKVRNPPKHIWIMFRTKDAWVYYFTVLGRQLWLYCAVFRKQFQVKKVPLGKQTINGNAVFFKSVFKEGETQHKI